MRTTEAECLAALREAADRLGESPTKAEYEELGLTPASTTIRRVVGGWNEAKEAAGLQTFEQGENGGTDIRSKPDEIELPDGTEWKELTSQQRWYYKNREHRIEIKENRRRELKRWFYRVKRDEMECAECEEKRPPALDLHHQDGKASDVSKMVNDGYSKSRIREEIDRCSVLCANCHRRKHYDGPDPSTLPTRSEIASLSTEASKDEVRRQRRRWLVAYKRDSDGCSSCAISEPVCLDFHHKRDKTMRVGQMVSFGKPLPEIRTEIKKCDILCANCHRHHHFDAPVSDD